MHPLLDIDAEHIKLLKPDDLRLLVGRLCLAEFQKHGMNMSAVDCSGDGSAADGGFDVLVASEIAPPSNCYIANPLTAFQVKKHNLPPSKIAGEMIKKGRLLPLIEALAVNRGRYIIISAADKSTVGTRPDRINAMRQCLGDLPIEVDFLNAGMIADWVRFHPSIIIWVRARIGQPLVGWMPYRNWTSPDQTEAPYLLDDKARLIESSSETQQALPLTEGIERLRASLSQPGKCVRLIGMSGVGKTRLVQALFDPHNIGTALNEHQVIYTNTTASVLPTPEAMAEHLCTLNVRTYLVVDDCSPELHNNLERICAENSNVSLATIEYDVRDNETEHTDVFILGPSSDHLIVSLLKNRFPKLSAANVERIAEFSGGNARLAFAVAKSIGNGGSIRGLKNDELFRRLFFQRNEVDPKLLRGAEFLSLLYSFNGEEASEGSEIAFVSNFSSISILELFAIQSQLAKRLLLQSKGPWRAILPEAIADWLAKAALSQLPVDSLLNWLGQLPPRMLMSFSKRLAFISEQAMASSIVKRWLMSEKWYNLNLFTVQYVRLTVLEFIAEIDPSATIDVIGKSFCLYSNQSSHQNRSSLLRILQRIAYEPTNFSSCIKVMVLACLNESPSSNYYSSRDVLKPLFYRRFAFTNAPIETRLKEIEQLWNGQTVDEKNLALELLECALEAWHFKPRLNPAIGAIRGGFGREYATEDELLTWYGNSLELATTFALEKSTFGEHAATIIGEKIRGIWLKAAAFGHIDIICRRIRNDRFWAEGWIAVKNIIRLDIANLPAEQQVCLGNLEVVLRPQELWQDVVSHALGELSAARDLIDEIYGGKFELYLANLNRLGQDLAKDDSSFVRLMPNIAAFGNTWNSELGRGYYAGSDGDQRVWDMFAIELENIEAPSRKLGFLKGWLWSCSQGDASTFIGLLDKLLHHQLYRQYFVSFLSSVSFTMECWSRLQYCIQNDLVEHPQYYEFVSSPGFYSLDDEQLSYLVKHLSIFDEHRSIIAGLHNRLVANASVWATPSPQLLTSVYKYFNESNWYYADRKRQEYDYANAETIRDLTARMNRAPDFEIFFNRYVKSVVAEETFLGGFSYSLTAMAQIDPHSALDSFLGNEEFYKWCKNELYLFDFNDNRNFLNELADSAIVSWCGHSPDLRYPLVIETIELVAFIDGAAQWREFVFEAIVRNGIRSKVLGFIENFIFPRLRSGPIVEFLQGRKLLMARLLDRTDLDIADWGRVILEKLQKDIEWEIQDQENRNKETVHDSFE